MPKFITLKEGTKITGLSYNFLRTLFIQGKLKGLRSGTKIFLDSEELIKALDKMSGGDTDAE